MGAGLLLHSGHKLCAMELHLSGGRKACFSLTQKGSKGYGGSIREAKTVVASGGLRAQWGEEEMK